MRLLKAAPVALLVGVMVFIWLLGSSNPVSPAGYVGYVTQGAVFGKARFYALQTGPTSPGRTWLLSVTNVSVTPYTYHEDFVGPTSVLSRDNLKISFSVHLVWKVRPDRVKEFVEKYSTLADERNPDRIVQTAYNNFLKEPLRTYARDEIQQLNGLEIKDKITPVGEAISRRVLELTKDTPFLVTSVVVGNIQYPDEVANAVSTKMAATQVLERKQIEIAIEEREKQKRIVQAEGIARSMEIINTRLTSQYLQHEAIESQRAMVGSPNHTTIYIPVGPMGVPLVGTFDVQRQPRPAPELTHPTR
jgi:regulator of protease activity HflC (stomatin/prohibitin superfamily)